MGTITTGIGLISGIDTATLIDNLIALEARGKTGLQVRLAVLQLVIDEAAPPRPHRTGTPGTCFITKYDRSGAQSCCSLAENVR